MNSNADLFEGSHHVPIEYDRKKRSHLADKQSDMASESPFFQRLFKKNTAKHPATGQRILDLENNENRYEVDTIVVQDCYEHLLPHVQHSILLGETLKDRRISITGKPGIGKTVYGALLMRQFVREGAVPDFAYSVVYWERDNIYLFTWKEELKEKFGLNNNIIELKNGRKLYGGFWEYGEQTSGFGDLLCHPDVIVIHDPKRGFNDVGLTTDKIKRIVFVLSDGHSLIDFWQVKGLGPGTEYFLPFRSESVEPWAS